VKQGHEHSHGDQGNIKIAFFFNLGFTILDIFGGLWTNSMAILSDAIHDLGVHYPWDLPGILIDIQRKAQMRIILSGMPDFLSFQP